MPQRIMGCDYAAYEEQIRTLVHQNKTTGKIYRKTRQSQLFPEIQEKSPPPSCQFPQKMLYSTRLTNYAQISPYIRLQRISVIKTGHIF